MPEAVTLDSWTYGARLLVGLAQTEAIQRGDLETTPAHLAFALMEMLPVRRAFEELKAYDDASKAVKRSLMVARKGQAKQPVVEMSLVKLIIDPLLTEPRNAATLVRRFSRGQSMIAPVEKPFAAMAKSIGEILDNPELENVLTKGTTDLSFVAMGLRLANERQHAQVSHRHVVLAWLNAYATEKAGTPYEERAKKLATELNDLVDRTTPKRTIAGTTWSARVIGAVCSGIAAPEQRAGVMLHVCWAEDDALANIRSLVADVVAAGKTKE
jgi:hypothetical protein